MAAASLSASATSFSSVPHLSNGARQFSPEGSAPCFSESLPSPLRGFGSSYGAPCAELRHNSVEPAACWMRGGGYGALGSSFHNPLRSRSRKIADLRTRGVRAEQDQKEREKEGQEGEHRTVRNVLKEMRDSRDVGEAAKKGAEAAKNEAKRDLDWYRSLKKPWFAPPEPVYGLAWTGLYAMMAAATYIVITEGGGVQKQALPLAIFAAQLYFNFKWPQLFFVEKKIGKAQIDNIFLLVSLIATYQLYNSVSPTAGRLILPSIVWVAFANVLNYVILMQNQED